MNLTKVGLFTICLLLLWLVSCSSSPAESGSYKIAEINEDIPVPANAESSKAQFDNPNIKKGEKYSLENFGGEQGLYPPNEYFEEIKNWGWEELEKEQMGHVHFFTKGDTIISIVIKEDYFYLVEMKEDFEFSHLKSPISY
ncbi:hypothetical protein PGC35_21115 [Psychrobacillus sp. PGGUH221]|uniref:hypothetical protein n=1 Tax=Psychrobacillus sp. PGGUH221 TaxID=3020058 RepID=UPI0035C726C6